MPPRLVHAPAAPPDRAEDLPVAHDLWVDAATADALVAAEEVLIVAEPADRPVDPEAPCSHAEVAEVLHGVPAVHELPVEDGADAVRPDDEVAIAKVAVDDDLVGRRRPVLVEPAQTELEGGARVVVGPAQKPDHPSKQLLEHKRDSQKVVHAGVKSGQLVLQVASTGQTDDG